MNIMIFAYVGPADLGSPPTLYTLRLARYENTSEKYAFRRSLDGQSGKAN